MPWWFGLPPFIIWFLLGAPEYPADPTGQYLGACRPLGCKAATALDPTHTCQPTGAWVPEPIGATCTGPSGQRPDLPGITIPPLPSLGFLS